MIGRSGQSTQPPETTLARTCLDVDCVSGVASAYYLIGVLAVKIELAVSHNGQEWSQKYLYRSQCMHGVSGYSRSPSNLLPIELIIDHVHKRPHLSSAEFSAVNSISHLYNVCHLLHIMHTHDVRASSDRSCHASCSAPAALFCFAHVCDLANESLSACAN